jgi:hypothetical protein
VLPGAGRRQLAERILDGLLSLSTAIFIAARWPQIFVSFRNRGVGQVRRTLPAQSYSEDSRSNFGKKKNNGGSVLLQLNIYTTLLYFAGNCVRIYTTRTQLQGDRISLLKSAASALGNFTMMAQVVTSPRLASPRRVINYCWQPV